VVEKPFGRTPKIRVNFEWINEVLHPFLEQVRRLLNVLPCAYSLNEGFALLLRLPKTRYTASSRAHHFATMLKRGPSMFATATPCHRMLLRQSSGRGMCVCAVGMCAPICPGNVHEFPYGP